MSDKTLKIRIANFALSTSNPIIIRDKLKNKLVKTRFIINDIGFAHKNIKDSNNI